MASQLGPTIRKVFDVDVAYGIALVAVTGTQFGLISGWIQKVPALPQVAAVAALIGLGMALYARFK